MLSNEPVWHHGWHMGFYDDRETAEQYIDMAAGYDGRELIEALRSHLPDGATLLEIGMGPGVDLKLLEQHYTVTGSDNSQYFLDRFRSSNPDADLLYLDAIEIETERKFDCVYSNKVLHHLTDEELAKSIRRQKEILSDGGLAMHSFWCGEGVDEHDDLRFVYQTEESLQAVFGEVFSKVTVVMYTEMEDEDSLYVLAS